MIEIGSSRGENERSQSLRGVLQIAWKFRGLL
jgi:hypothetical protein